MATWTGQNLHQDDAGIKTSSRYGVVDTAATIPAATSDFYAYVNVPDGGDASQGKRADAAVTDPAVSGTMVSLLKGLLTFLRISAAGLGKTEDAVHASGDTGVMMLGVRQDTAAALAGTTGDYMPPTMDALGRLRVRNRFDEVDALNARTTALATNLVVKASAGKLMGFQGYSSAVGFVLVHNTASLPADGQVPAEVIPVEAGKPFSFDAGIRGIAFATGITIVFSTTGPTKTLGSAAMWVSAQYE